MHEEDSMSNSDGPNQVSEGAKERQRTVTEATTRTRFGFPWIVSGDGS
jgi:hypothetical protein